MTDSKPMRTHRFTREAGALLVIDVQERLAAAMPQARMDALFKNAGLHHQVMHAE